MSEYKIISSYNCKILEREVNQAISDGWAAVGGVTVLPDPSTRGLLYYQAVVK